MHDKASSSSEGGEGAALVGGVGAEQGGVDDFVVVDEGGADQARAGQAAILSAADGREGFDFAGFQFC